MRCPKCEQIDDKVIDTRVSKEGESIRRRRECLGCGHRFTTYEMVMRVERVVVKSDGSREDYAPKKLREGVKMACWKRPVSEAQIDQIVHTIDERLEKIAEREIPSKAIGELVMEELRKVDDVAYVRFASVYRRFTHADQFINEIRSLTDKPE